MHLVLLLEAEGAGEEGGRAGVRAHVGDTPRLQEQRKEEEVKTSCSRRFQQALLLLLACLVLEAAVDDAAGSALHSRARFGSARRRR